MAAANFTDGLSAQDLFSTGEGLTDKKKRLSEKRRQEQENIYIDELAELVSATLPDISSLSVKHDKCTILQEAVKQVQAEIHRNSFEQTKSLISTEAAVEHGEVSSSKPTRISSIDITPLLLMALDGFLLFVNSEGQIKFVTEKITQILHYDKEELLGKSVYNIIHRDDHSRFGVLLNNPFVISDSSVLSLGSNLQMTPYMEQLSSGSKGNSWFNYQKFNPKLNCRLLMKPLTDQDQTIEERQTMVSQYETLQISSTKIYDLMIDDEESADGCGQNLLCIALQVPYNEKHLSPPLEKFSIKLDRNGEILSLDTQYVSDVYAQYISKDLLVGRMLHDICHKSDALIVTKLIQETQQAGYSISPVYKLHLTDDEYVNIQTQSKYFKTNDLQSDFIMTTHSIVGDSEMCAMIENNASRAAIDQLSESLNGNDLLLSITSIIGSNQPVIKQKGHSNKDLLLKSMGFRILSSATSPDSHGRKRNSMCADDENDQPPLKRTNNFARSSPEPSALESLQSLSSPSDSQAQVTNSKLGERNKMLESLLSKDQPPNRNTCFCDICYNAGFHY